MPKDKPKSELALARKGKVGKISIDGDIGWDYFGMSYSGFKQALADLGKVDIIEIEHRAVDLGAHVVGRISHRGGGR